jgi:glycosyltransferase involved in cell wall biosynthesis
VSERLPSISIIIPARNEACFVARCIESVITQSISAEVEGIVVDNGSRDETAAIAGRFGAGGAPIRIQVIGEPTQGVGRAKNAGAAHALGAVLIFLDADSRMVSDLAEAVWASYQAGFRVGSIRVAADGGGKVDASFFELIELGKRWFGIRAQMLYCERQLFHQLGGFDSGLTLGEDAEFLARAGHRLKNEGCPNVCHVSSSRILTSSRRLTAHHHLGMARMFARWLLAFVHVGRRRSY